MTGEQTTGPGPATDRRRIGVWENEGGHLALGVLAATEAPAPTDATARWMRAVPLSDLPEEEAIHLELSGVPICLARSDGVVHALLDECSHGQVALSDGEVTGGVVECWLHGSCFDLVTGVPTGPPAMVPVPVYPIRVVADIVEVAI
ncbi:non-heme iron oxygenase ferredoxin subunit [Nocardioides currus]|nr:non-heme iron oxygenase ferredoxin subunit [Nocardioides currus]